MIIFNRLLKMDLPKGQSAFLRGARKTGKSFYLKNNFKNSLYYDLLKTDEVWRFLKQPSLLREEVLALSPEWLAKPIIVDEIQKVPDLLNEIALVIENTALARI